MKYLQKSFSVGGPIQVSQEDWDAIWAPKPETPLEPPPTLLKELLRWKPKQREEAHRRRRARR